MSVPSRTSQGLSNVNEAALRQSGSEACHSFYSLYAASSDLMYEVLLIKLLPIDILLL